MRQYGFDGGVVKLLLNFFHVWIITSFKKQYIEMIILPVTLLNDFNNIGLSCLY